MYYLYTHTKNLIFIMITPASECPVLPLKPNLSESAE